MRPLPRVMRPGPVSTAVETAGSLNAPTLSANKGKPWTPPGLIVCDVLEDTAGKLSRCFAGGLNIERTPGLGTSRFVVSAIEEGDIAAVKELVDCATPGAETILSNHRKFETWCAANPNITSMGLAIAMYATQAAKTLSRCRCVSGPRYPRCGASPICPFFFSLKSKKKKNEKSLFL